MTFNSLHGFSPVLDCCGILADAGDMSHERQMSFT
jgi:hypothetical protein